MLSSLVRMVFPKYLCKTYMYSTFTAQFKQHYFLCEILEDNIANF